MKQYDKIWIPNDREEKANQYVLHGPYSLEGICGLDPINNCIVVSIEELSNLWNAAHSAGMEDAGAKLKKPAVDFETYLQSKGINI